MTGTWGTPELVENDASGVTDHRMVTAPNGTAVAVWREERANGSQTLSSVHARAYSPATGWGASVAFNVAGTDDAGEPQVAINANGDAMVVWVQSSAPVSGTRRFNVSSVQYKTGVWDTVPTNVLGATDIPDAGFSMGLNSHRIALDDTGNAIFAFTVATITDAPDGAWVKRYRNGVWEAATRFLAGATSNAYDLTMAAAPNGGKATAIWRQLNTTTNKVRILASEYTEGSGWTAGHTIDGDVTGSYSNLRVAIAANGDTVAAWENQPGGSRTDVYASRLAGGTWSNPAIVTSTSIGRATDFMVGLCSDASGNAMMMTLPFDLAQVAATRYTVGTGWGAPTQVPPEGQAFTVPQASVACNTKGDAMVSWRAALGSDNSYNLWARPYSAGSGWGTAAQIVSLGSVYTTGLTLSTPVVGLDDSGKALTIWRQDDQPGTALNKLQNLWSASFK